MSQINTGGPAFPSRDVHTDGRVFFEEGMTLRDYFAAGASDADVWAQAEVLRAKMPHGIGILPDDWRVTARYMHADAMIAAREKGGDS